MSGSTECKNHVSNKKSFYKGIAPSVLFSLVIYLYALNFNKVESIIIVYPKSVSSSYKITNLANIKCPKQSDYLIKPKWATNTAVRMYKPKIETSIEIPGYICKTIKLSHTCIENWLFSSSYKKELTIVKSKVEDCLLEIERSLSGSVDPLSYPDPVCRYGTDNVQVTYKLAITRMSMPYDPYKNTVTSNHLLNHECSRTPCLTSNGNSLWVVDHNHEKFCNDISDFDSIDVWIKDKFNNITDNEFWSHDELLGRVKFACKLKYCNKEGIRFQNGDWIAFKDADTALNSNFANKLKECNKNSKINTLDTIGIIDNRFISHDARYKKENCLKSRIQFLEDRSISRSSLQDLMPTTPGKHPVYFILNNTIGEYVKINLSSVVSEGKIGTLVSDLTDMKDDLFTQPNAMQVRDGPNGLIVLKDKIIYKYSMMDSDDNTLLQDLHLHNVKFDFTKPDESFSNQISDETQKISQESSDDTSKSVGLENFTKSAWNTIRSLMWVKYTLWIIIILIVIFIIGKVLRCLNLVTSDWTKLIGRLTVRNSRIRSSQLPNTVHYRLK